ncbi:MAG: histidine kinase [Rikenellaceae bacterium]
MIRERKILTIEYTAIILLWTLVVVFPLLFMDDINQNWRGVYVLWSECTVVGFAFLVNRFILMPRLFFSRRYIAYISSLIALFTILGVFVLHYDGVNVILSIFGYGGDVAGDIAPPIMSAPPPSMPPHAIHPTVAPHAAAHHAVTVIPPTISVLILSVIVIALDMGLSIAFKWIISEHKQAEINKERISAQLSNLQSQVSPHFFMNTLNNIHALVDIDSKRAKQTIIELSNLMDYLLYESSSQECVLLQKELLFIRNYINLMRLRYSKQVKIEFSHSDNIPPVKIPSLLFLNFIENAFKYGVDYEQDSFIKIHFEFDHTSIRMTASNSNHSSSVNGNRHGLGISNSRKRLNLLYDNEYTLDITDIDRVYFVDLKIPIAYD